MYIRTLVFVLCISLIPSAIGHSWVACTDYDPDADKTNYEPSKCRGFPRGWSTMGNPGFGEDRGFNYQGSEGAACRDPMGSAPYYGYTAQFPMATYTPGQEVCLAWPSKNHVAATCTNPYIPDTALAIYRSGPNPTSSVSQSEFKKNVVVGEFNGKHQNGVIDFKGFQNCPRFCDNMDKSTCTGCFTVPELQAGAVYTFQWYWVFNEGSAPYTTCWEAKIAGASQTATTGQPPMTTGQQVPVTTGQQTPMTTGQQPPMTTGQQPPMTTGQQPPMTTGQQTPVTTGTQAPQDIISILNAPTIIPIVGTFDIEVAYSSTGNRAIVVEVLDNQGISYGQGMINVGATKGSLTITVSITSVLNKRQGYIVRAVIVDQVWAQTPKGYELDADQVTVMADDTVVYATMEQLILRRNPSPQR